MIAASWPRSRTLDNGLLVVRGRAASVQVSQVRRLADHLEAGDLLVLNDAATLPGSLRGQLKSGSPVEVRLIGEKEDGNWSAAVLGPGDWRQKTEDRPAVDDLSAGDVIEFGEGWMARVTRVRASRLIELAFETGGDLFWKRLYRWAKPIQYSYLRDELPHWAVQTAYASKPWAVEMPSAGHALRWETLLELRKKGVAVASLTHAAGISSTGDPETDRRLPLAERYSIPRETVDAIRRARRVIAVGTSVVRALEGCRLRNGELVAGDGITGLRLGRSSRLRVVDGVLTGIHELGESHFRLLESFVPRALLLHSLALADAEGFASHEFGDSCLILPE